MNNVWEPIDSACYVKDTSVQPEDQYDCTFVLVAPKKRIGTLLPRHRRELGERPFHDHLPTQKLSSIQESFSKEQQTKEPEKHRSAKASPSKRFHLSMRYNPSTNPFVKKDERQRWQSSFSSTQICHESRHARCRCSSNTANPKRKHRKHRSSHGAPTLPPEA